MQNRRAREDYAEKRKGELCHWNIHPESKLTILKIIEIAEAVQQAAKKPLRPPRISAVLDLICHLQQVSVLTDVFLRVTTS
jgi:hypothetical protein